MADFILSSDTWRLLLWLDLLRSRVPTACVLCKGRTQGGGLCVGCTEDWHYRYKQVRWRCQRCKVAQLGGVARTVSQCQSCQDYPLALYQLAVAFDYVMPLDSLIWRFKERHQLRLAPVLARMMQQSILRDGWSLPPDTVVGYIPSRSSALRVRGFNPAAELARYLARLLGLKMQYSMLGLQDQSENRAQKHRNQHQRWDYAQQAFKWQASNTPSTLLLVDDVYTTGSTLHGAACCARQHGVDQVYGVTLARVPWVT